MRAAILSLILTMSCSLASAQDAEADAKTILGSGKPDTTVTILAQPKTFRPFDWKQGEKVTIGLRVTGPDETRVIGLATDLLLHATKIHENRVEMIIRGDEAALKKLSEAAGVSELWFEVMPFAEDHIEALKSDIDYHKFLKKNSDFRPAGAAEWCVGGNLRAPVGEELPKRQ
jgi:hypothetical protein